MNANGLMLNDWVKTTLTDKPLKVESINLTQLRCRYKKTSSYDSEDNFDPILLTDEILKANGWEKHKYPDDIYYRLSAELWGEYHEVFELEENYDGNGYWIHLGIGGYFTRLKYVHELQHALRLCGLNELADNLKIE